MAKKNFPPQISPSLEPAHREADLYEIAYRVKPGGDCTIGDKVYSPGDLLPSDLPIDQLNHHLPFCEIVQIKRESVLEKPELTPEETVEIMDQENANL